MAREDDLLENNEVTPTTSSDLNQSLVKKVTALLPTSISKWFGKSQSLTRRRESDSSENDSIIMEQPPCKRSRIPQSDGDELWAKQKISNGSLPLVNIKTQVKTSELLNNIRPRQSYTKNRNTNYNRLDWLPNLNSNYSSNRLDNEEPVAGPSGLQRKTVITDYSHDSTLILSKLQTSSTKNSGIENKKNNSSPESSIIGDNVSILSQKNSEIFTDTSPNSTVVSSSHQDNTSNNAERSKRMKYYESNLRNQTSGNQSIRSLFEDSLSPRKNVTSLSTRRPSFNTSAFGTPSLIDNTLSTERAANSPFYSGQTMFGGASAYRRSRPVGSGPSPPSARLRNSIQIKPTNEQIMKNNDSANMSQTAKRILDALENFNTPTEEAKKIPRLNISSKQLLGGLEENRRKIINSRSPFSRVMKPKIPMKELSIPTVPDILQIKRREKIIERKKETLNDQEKLPTLNLPNITLPITTLPNFDFIPKPITPVQSTTTKQQTEKIVTPSLTEEVVAVVNEAQNSNQLMKSDKNSKKKSESVMYQFAPPIKIGTSYTKTLMPINNFKFSKPITLDEPLMKKDVLNFKYSSNDNICLKRKSIHENTDKNIFDLKPKPVSNFQISSSDIWECKMCMLKNNIELEKCTSCGLMKSAATNSNLVTNSSSASNTFGKEFKITSDKWECSTCLVRNNNSVDRCVACTTLKPGTKVQEAKPSPSLGFGNKFKVDKDTWECSACLIRNKNNIIKCVACETPKGGNLEKSSFKTNSELNNSKSGFGNSSIKKSTDWECLTCKIKNPENKTECSCCEAPKSILSTPFKFGIDKAEATPNTSAGTKSTGFIYGVANSTAVNAIPAVSTATTTSTGFSFGIPSTEKKSNEESNKILITTSNSKQSSTPNITESMQPMSNLFSSYTKKSNQWECPSCMVRNDDDKLTCVCCETPKSGAKVISAPAKSSGIELPTSTPFKFGFDKVDSKVSNKIQMTTPQSSTFTFGIPTSVATTQSATTSQFSFGVPSKLSPTPITTVADKSSASSTGTVTQKDVNSSKNISNDLAPQKNLTAPIIFGGPSTTVFGTNNVPSSSLFKSSPPNVTSGTSTFAVTASPVTTASSTMFTNNQSNLTSNVNSTFTPTNTPFGDSGITAGFGKPSTINTNKTVDTNPTSVFGSNTSTFTLGDKKNDKIPTTSTFAFGNGPTSMKPTEKSFAFGSSSDSAEKKSSGFSFGSADQAATEKKTSGFTFGSADQAPEKRTGFTFGSADQGTNEKKTSGFTFGSTDQATNEKKNTGFTFGSVDPATSERKTSGFTFGNAEQQADKKTPGFTFGTTDPITTEKKAPLFAFGSVDSTVNSTAEKKVPGFTFGTAETSKVPSFSFNPTSTFDFGTKQTSIVNTPAPGGFALNSIPPIKSAIPAFGATTNNNSNPFGVSSQPVQNVPANPSFGAAAPVFGSTATSTAAAASSPAFQFGATANQTSSPVFSFGNSSQGQTGQSGTTAPAPFGFGSAQQTPAAPSIPTFNPNTKPQFNFTSGAATAFTAQPTLGSPLAANPQRRIKKAVRRARGAP